MVDTKQTNNDSGGRVGLTVIIVLLILTPFVYAIADRVIPAGADLDTEFLEYPGPEHPECVRDTEYMRHHHWELLTGVREEVVRYGVRGDVSLDKCKDCHTSREQFCNKCHNAVSLQPDCFGCHYYP